MPDDRKRRALHACQTCRSRKKGCDKTLPSCSYCKERTLECSYEWKTHSFDNNNAILQNSSSPATGSMVDNGRLVKPTSVDEMMHLYVCDVQKSTGISVRDAISRYLGGPYTWLPMIPPSILFIMGENGHRTSAASISILILAIYLMITPLAQLSKGSGPEDSQYVYIKKLFGYVQALSCASTSLLQALLLITTYEFASGKQESAFISIAACVRMAQILDIDDAMSKGDPEQLSTKESESVRIWQGILVLERHILSVLPPEFYHPMTKLPPESAAMQSDLSTNFGENDKPSCPEDLSLQEHPVWLLDKVCSFRLSSADKMGKDQLVKARDIDVQIWQFLSAAIEDCGRDNALSCGPIATAVRALFLLHMHIFATTQPDMLERETYHGRSDSALESAMRMFFDVSIDHVKHCEADRLPLCGRYNIDLVLSYLDHHARYSFGDNDIRYFKAAILRLKAKVEERWNQPLNLVF
ncbi:hypothetical protein F5Y16DRAFT_384508 [Xylariaceae sp. FL0255]|nr:hypothetical protein F5Y16DRAFT_384508 [Xylariaceae sp. FL0255]